MADSIIAPMTKEGSLTDLTTQHEVVEVVEEEKSTIVFADADSIVGEVDFDISTPATPAKGSFLSKCIFFFDSTYLYFRTGSRTGECINSGNTVNTGNTRIKIGSTFLSPLDRFAHSLSSSTRTKYPPASLFRKTVPKQNRA